MAAKVRRGEVTASSARAIHRFSGTIFGRSTNSFSKNKKTRVSSLVSDYDVQRLNNVCMQRDPSQMQIQQGETNQSTEELQLRVMRVIARNPEISQRALSKELGVSLGGVNYCLKALVEMGFVKLGNFTRPSRKLGYAYILTPQGIQEKSQITARFLRQKMQEYEAIEAEIEQLKDELDDDAYPLSGPRAGL